MVRFSARVVFSAGGRKERQAANQRKQEGNSLHSYSMVGLVMKITLSNRNYISSLSSALPEQKENLLYIRAKWHRS